MTDMNKPYRAVRRIVTGVDENGRSIILMDGLAENVTQADHSPLVAHVLWATGESAAPGIPLQPGSGHASPSGCRLRYPVSARSEMPGPG